jgi:hypothetical protein
MDADTPTADPLAEATARSRADERRTVLGKAAIVELTAAVLRCDPGTLPPEVRAARERVERVTNTEDTSR